MSNWHDRPTLSGASGSVAAILLLAALTSRGLGPVAVLRLKAAQCKHRTIHLVFYHAGSGEPISNCLARFRYVDPETSEIGVPRYPQLWMENSECQIPEYPHNEWFACDEEGYHPWIWMQTAHELYNSQLTCMEGVQMMLLPQSSS